MDIEGAGRLIEDEDRRVFEECPRDRDALSFAAGQLPSEFTHMGVVRFRDAPDALVRARRIRRAFRFSGTSGRSSRIWRNRSIPASDIWTSRTFFPISFSGEYSWVR